MTALDEMIASLRKLDGALEAVAKEASPLVQSALRETAAAGVDPDTGAPWPAKLDGSRPMVNAASHVTSAAVGQLVVSKLSGPDVFHQNSKSKPRRVIPDGGAGLSDGVTQALTTAAKRVFDRAMALR
jgi:hypothetical protein